MPRKSYSLILLALLAVFSVSSIFGVTIPSLLSSGASCPTNRTITAVTEPIPSSFNFLNPSGDSTYFVGSLEFLGLSPFPLQPNGSLDWTDTLTNWITSNSNYTQWLFHIKPGATWSNGTAVTAQDVVTWASPSYALNPQYDFVGLHSQVTGVHAVNSDTAEFDLNVSDAQFPNLVAMYYYAPVVPPSAVAQGPNAELFGTGVADGPWYTSGYTSGETNMLMLPNPYWNGPKPTACALSIIFVENSAAEIPFLVSGQADFATPLSFGNIASLQGLSNIHLHSQNAAFGTQLVYNVTSYPYNVTLFRQALAYSINTTAIVQHAEFGFGVAANNAQGEVPSTFSFYEPNQVQYPYNVSEALSLLHQLGFSGGGSPSTPLLFPNGTAMSLTIYTDTGKAWDPDVARLVGGFLQDLGIAVQTQTVTPQNLAADYSSNAFNIRNNLVIYSSGGPIYVSPWLDGQVGCNVLGNPGCYGWQATPSPYSPSGQTQWLYPASADKQYQSNLTALNNTPPTNVSGQVHYLKNIQLLEAQYLPVIMLGYPDAIRAYNTAKWTAWPSYDFAIGEYANLTMFNALQPVSSSTTTTTTTQTTTTSITTTASATTSTTTSATTPSTSTTSSSTSTGIAYPGIGVLIVIATIMLASLAFFSMRRNKWQHMKSIK